MEENGASNTFQLPTVEGIDAEIAKTKKYLASLRSIQKVTYQVAGKELPKKPRRKSS